MRTVTEDTRKRVAEAIREAHGYALDGMSAQVFYDTETGAVETTVVPGACGTETQIRVTEVRPYTLRELYGDDPELIADPEGFREWYLTSGEVGDDSYTIERLESAIDELERSQKARAEAEEWYRNRTEEEIDADIRRMHAEWEREDAEEERKEEK